MKEILIALLTAGAGLFLLFFGYRLARLLIPLWGFITGVSLGGALIANMQSTPFLGTVLGVTIGLLLGVIFAAFAYMYYAIAVIILGVGLGYWAGSELMLFVGFNPGLISVVTGILIGTVFGAAAVAFNAPRVILIVGTAIAGAVSTIGAALLLFNQISLDQFSYSTAHATIASSGWWTFAMVLLALIGFGAQSRADEDYELEKWSSGHVAHSSPIVRHP
jgi:hypothetical protein